ncbi:MAG: Ig-like domain repeat protein [Verrucomicrobia bacterium]|nr:Ig-like domain repeat protein [Verrucomicrobiota bacterium]
MGGGSITGAGQIRGLWNSTSSPRTLTIEDVKDVSLASIDVHVENVNNSGRNLNLNATGRVEISLIDTSDVQTTGGDAGDVNISAGVISVGTIKAFAARSQSPQVNNGNITLNAVGAPAYDPNTAAGNTILNRLILSGSIATSVQKQSTATLTLNAGVYPNGVGAVVGDVFTNGTTNVLTPGYIVQWTTAATTATVSSSANPVCPGTAVSFTANVTSAGSGTPVGAVQFQTNGVNCGSTVPLSGGSAVSPAVVLPVGNSVVTAVYSGNTNFAASTAADFTQTVRSNSVPVAKNISLGAVSNAPSTVKIIGGSNAPTDADGDALLVTAVTQGTNGTVATDGTNVTYTATNAFTGTDFFTYRVGDACGNSTPATATVAVIASSAGFNQLKPTGSVINGTVVLNYLGLPGYNCALEWATNLTPPVSWRPLITNTVATNGLLNFTNTSSALLNFFRARYFP